MEEFFGATKLGFAIYQFFENLIATPFLDLFLLHRIYRFLSYGNAFSCLVLIRQ